MALEFVAFQGNPKSTKKSKESEITHPLLAVRQRTTFAKTNYTEDHWTRL